MFLTPRRVTVSIALMAVLWIPATAQELPDSTEIEESFSASDVSAAQEFGQTLGIAEWLGPLAPVALSPFFGITCLAGMSLYGQGWIAADNSFLGESSALHNPAVFWIFLGLTVLTSLPRLTKVSKPFAQAVDQGEAWSGIITMVVLRFMLTATTPDAEQLEVTRMGFLSASTNTLLMIAAAVNIFVINAVKFFFEMLIWITPIPAIDAVFEAANKMACGLLMAIYGYSPTLAAAINIGMFVVAAILFRWAYRREVFFRIMLMDALRAFLFRPGTVTQPEVCVFPSQQIGPIPVAARCLLRRTESGWSLTQRRLLSQDFIIEISENDCSISLTPGWFTNRLELTGDPSASLTFSRRFNACLPELATAMGAALAQEGLAPVRDHRQLKAEMA